MTRSMLLRSFSRPWQVRRGNSESKVSLVAPVLQAAVCLSVLDVGCNAGVVSRLLAKNHFVVGIDQKLSMGGFRNPLKGVCLGEVKLTDNVLDQIPEFDAICLFSVHHQWIHDFGDAEAMRLLGRLATKAKKCLLIEFAGLNKKYQSSGPSRFQDNDEPSILAYANGWLKEVLPGWSIRFLGTTPESSREPFRFMFACMR